MANDLVLKPEKAISILQERKELLNSIVNEDDIVEIQGKPFKKKSYWRKLGIIFGLSIDVIKEEKEINPKTGEVTYHITAKAIAPNGQYTIGLGSCSQFEKGKRRTIHETRTTAETRAKNRAISDMLAWGEVSAEEVEAEYGYGQVERQERRQERKVEAEVVKDNQMNKLDEGKALIIWAVKKGILNNNDVKDLIRAFKVNRWEELDGDKKEKAMQILASVIIDTLKKAGVLSLDIEINSETSYNECLKKLREVKEIVESN